jgi:hypothetical protein
LFFCFHCRFKGKPLKYYTEVVLHGQRFNLKEHAQSYQPKFLPLDTFIAMAYILAVNPQILSADRNGSGRFVYIDRCCRGDRDGLQRSLPTTQSLWVRQG